MADAKLNLRFLPDVPVGMRILSADEEIAGIQHRLANARAFARGRKHQLQFQREPNNRHDPNAIKVVGIYKGCFFPHSVHLGYVSAPTAKLIVEGHLAFRVQPRLKNIWWGGYVRDWITVRFDVLEPSAPRDPKPKRVGKTSKASQSGGPSADP